MVRCPQRGGVYAPGFHLGLAGEVCENREVVFAAAVPAAWGQAGLVGAAALARPTTNGPLPC
ncbi:hypothetical protein [Thiococcus pfennigii]|jgi:hypothetical protein|uniref:hypothetical protein n=1 Tax=Thiococcus pfennigii TaxID=1057 RepID=UPI0019056E86|nr:hypothetical protein [Thiococcus pfennigii]MBK1732484.1 hypothetical protein [Thiococcus pfennigii]